MKVILSPNAKNQLSDIYEYFREIGLGKYGRKVRARVLAKTMKLKDFPRLGPVEENMTPSKIEFRYLVEGNYKIIYTILEKEILITDIFDTRQDPEKM